MTKNPRMCIICRKRFQKSELIRTIKTTERVIEDVSGKAQARGTYICKSEECLIKAKKRSLI